MNNLARKEVIDQVPCTSRLDETTSRFKSVTEFLDHVEMGVRDFVRQMLARIRRGRVPPIHRRQALRANPSCEKTVEMGLGQGNSKRALVSLRICGCPGAGNRERLTALFWAATGDRMSGSTRSSLRCSSVGSPPARWVRSPICSGAAR